jgi:uncharacterized protein DUF5681
MPFTKGKSGNKNGRPKKLKPLTEALRVALNRIEMDDDGKRKKTSMLVANALVRKAKQGHVPASSLIFDRVEGKPGSHFGEGAEFSLLEAINASYRIQREREAEAKAKLIEHAPILEATDRLKKIKAKSHEPISSRRTGSPRTSSLATPTPSRKRTSLFDGDNAPKFSGKIWSAEPAMNYARLHPLRPCTHKSRLVSSGWSMSALPPKSGHSSAH